MRRKLGFILAMVLGLGGLLLAVVPARADSGSPLADARERANGILVQLQTLDNVCITILSALIHEVDIDVLEARKLITVGKGNLTRLLFDTLVTSAGEGFDRINATLEQCDSLLGSEGDGSTDGTVFGEVAGLQEDIGNLDNIDQRKRFKIDSLLENIVTGNLNSISTRVQTDGSIATKTGSVEELLSGSVKDCLDDPSSCGLSKTDFTCEATTHGQSEPITAIPQMTESGPFSFEQLRDLKIVLGLAHQCLTRAIREVNRLPGFKKWVLKGVREVFELLRSSNFGGHGASEVIAVTTDGGSKDGTRTIADIREDFSGLLIELDTIDNVCVTILGALFNEELISVLEARKLITVGKGNLNALLEELTADFEATQEKIVNTIAQCANEDNGLISTFIEELGTLTDEIDGLREPDGTLDNRKATKIVSLLKLAKTLAEDVLEHIGTLKDDSETLKEDLVSCTDSLRGNSADLHVQPQMTESGPFSFGALREFKICLGKAYAQLRSFLTVIREFTRHKKWILKAVRETRELLRNTNFGGHGASEITGLTAGVTKIYTLGGALITTQTSGLNVSSLANGVYLAVTELRDALGNVRQQIRKVTVVH